MSAPGRLPTGSYPTPKPEKLPFPATSQKTHMRSFFPIFAYPTFAVYSSARCANLGALR